MSDRFNPPWRLVAGAVYRMPTDSRIYGSMEFDVTDVMTFIRKRRKQGVRMTLTHVIAAATARAIAFEVPELNCYMQRGRIVPRTSMDAMISVNIRGREMSAVKVRDAHARPVSEIAEVVRTQARAHRSSDESNVAQNKQLLSKIPWPLRSWAFRFLRFVTGELGLKIERLGLSPNTFGSFLLSDVGSLGLSNGMAALLPAAKYPVVFVLGRAEEKPVVRGGEIVIREMVTLTGTFDHRIVDGAQGGQLARAIARELKRFEQLDRVPVERLPESLFPVHTFEVQKSDAAPHHEYQHEVNH